MLRREFIAGLGSAAAWPVVARAQQGDRVRRIGVLMPFEENHPEGKLRYAAFAQALADLGWTEGRNLRMDLRWGGDDTNRVRALAQELVGLQPDIILTNTTLATSALHGTLKGGRPLGQRDNNRRISQPMPPGPVRGRPQG